MSEITFEPTKHEYFHEGKKLKSVTTILRACGFGQDFAPIPEGERTAAMEKGTLIHQMVALAIEGALDEDQLDPKLKPYLEAFKKFCKYHKPKFHRWEFIVGDPEDGWAGTCDVEMTIGKKHGIGDWKSGQKQKQYRIQTYAYRSAVEKAEARWCIYLGDDGNYILEEHEEESDRAAWRNCLELTQWRADRGRK